LKTDKKAFLVSGTFITVQLAQQMIRDLIHVFTEREK